MPANVSTKIAEALMKHDIDLMRFDAKLRSRVVGLLNGLERSLVTKLKRTDPTAPAKIAFKNKQMRLLFEATGKTIGDAYNEIGTVMGDDLDDLAIVEAASVADITNRTVGAELMGERLDENVLASLANKVQIEGDVARKWWATQSTQLRESFVREVRDGVLGNETIDDIVRRVRGTKAANFKDGIMETSRRKAKALVRTGVLSVANDSRMRMYEQNSDVIKGQQWLSTLDSRTTHICMALDGQAWFLDGTRMPGTASPWRGPPPAHFQCRSTLIPVLRSWGELTKSKKGKARVAKLPASKIATLRESLDGGVSSDLRYEDWLRRQPEDFQVEVLGAKRHALWKKGLISFTDLIDQSHRPMDVVALAKKVEDKKTLPFVMKRAENRITARGKEIAAEAKAAESAAKKAKLEKEAEAAKQKSASLKLEAIANEDKPFLAPALEKLKDTAAYKGLEPTARLALVEANAKVLEQRALLVGYKKAKVDDDPVTPKQAKAYAALSADEKAEVDVDIVKKKQAKEVAEKEKAAGDEIDTLSASDGVHGKALADLFGTPVFDNASNVEKLAQLKARAKVVKEAAFKKVYVTFSATNKQSSISPEIEDFFNALSPAKKKAWRESVAARKIELLETNPAMLGMTDEKIEALKDVIKHPDIEGKATATAKWAAATERATEVLTKAFKQKQIDDFVNASVSGSGATPQQKFVLESLLTQEEFDAVLKKIDNLSGASADLSAIAAGTFKAGTKKKLTGMQKALAESKNDPDFIALTATEKIAFLKQKGDEFSAAVTAKHQITKFKKSAVEGKTPTPAAQAAFDSLSDDEQKKVMDDVAKKLGKKEPKVATPSATVTPSDELNLADFDQIGPQRGSNTGGLYQNRETGERFYVKFPDTAEHVKNEVLAAKLYELMGVDVPTLRFVKDGNRVGVASSFIDDLKRLPPNELKGLAGAQEGFVADAWLANWDVIGLEFDNLLGKAGKAYRIDPGGALLFRAQGAPKGAAFGSVVKELDSLRTSSQGKKVFGSIPDATLKTGAERLAKVSDDDIRKLVKEIGLDNSLADTLVARKSDILKRFGITDKAIPPELKEIRDEFIANIVLEREAMLRTATSQLDEAISIAAKSIAARYKAGDVVRGVDLNRANTATNAYATALKLAHENGTPDLVDALEAHYALWVGRIDAAVASGEGGALQWTSGQRFAAYKGKIDIDRAKIREPSIEELKAAKEFLPEAVISQAAKTAGFGAIDRYRMSMGTKRTAAIRNALNLIPVGQRDAISAYTAQNYQAINNVIKGKGDFPAEKRAAINIVAKAANQGLKAAGDKAIYKGVATRGAGSRDPTAHMKMHVDALNTGEPVKYNSFLSTTRKKNPDFSGQFRYIINSKTGVDVEAISHHPSEQEILFSPDAKFYVDKIEEKSGYTYFYLTEV